MRVTQQRRVKGLALTTSLVITGIAGALAGFYLLLALYFLVIGGPQVLVEEFSGTAAAARRASGASPSIGSVIVLILGASLGLVTGAHLWRQAAVRLFRLDRQDADRIMAGTWNARPSGR